MNNHKITSVIGISSLLLQLSAWAEEPLQLESLSISDSHLESASGPVEGYRATRSATATRTDTDIRDTPQTIEVIPSQVLEDLGSTRIDRALDFAGGVSRQLPAAQTRRPVPRANRRTPEHFPQPGGKAHRQRHEALPGADARVGSALIS